MLALVAGCATVQDDVEPAPQRVVGRYERQSSRIVCVAYYDLQDKAEFEQASRLLQYWYGIYRLAERESSPSGREVHWAVFADLLSERLKAAYREALNTSHRPLCTSTSAAAARNHLLKLATSRA